nr:hypothetical protein Iba_chr05dCG16950 [Ipomoea batatas]
MEWDDSKHSIFMRAANDRGGITKAKANEIWTDMVFYEPGLISTLTRAQVASHLQKIRNYKTEKPEGQKRRMNKKAILHLRYLLEPSLRPHTSDKIVDDWSIFLGEFNNSYPSPRQVDDHHNHLLPREKENRSDQYLDSSSNDNANVSAFGNVNVASGNQDAQVPGEGSSPMNDPKDFEALLMDFLGVTVDDNSGTNQIENLSNDSRNQVNTNQTSIPNQLMGNQYEQNYDYGYNPEYQREISQANNNHQYSYQPQACPGL